MSARGVQTAAPCAIGGRGIGWSAPRGQRGRYPMILRSRLLGSVVDELAARRIRFAALQPIDDEDLGADRNAII